jgi:hypothetical protein
MKTLILSSIRCSIIFTAAAALLVVSPLTQAGYIVTLQQAGSNVVATGSGAIDLTGLTLFSQFVSPAQVNPSGGFIITGPASFVTGDAYVGIFGGPTSFGSGFSTLANSGSGDMVGFAAGACLAAAL